MCTGCWNYNELNDLAIVTSMALDKDGDDIILSAIVANGEKEISDNNSSKVVVYEGRGKNFIDAKIDLESYLPKKVYLGHLTSLIIGESVDNLDYIIDVLLRNSETIRRYYIIIAKNNKARDILKILSPLEIFTSNNIKNNIKFSGEFQAITNGIIFSDFLVKYYSDGIEPIAPSIEIVGSIKEGESKDNIKNSTPDTNLKVSTLAVFKESSFIGFLNENESIGTNILLNNASKAIISYPCDNGYITVKLDKLKTKVKNKIFNYDINITGAGEVVEVSCRFKLDSNQKLEIVENNVNKEVIKIVNLAIDAAVYKYESDIIGFGKLFYQNNPKYWNEIKDNWNNLYLKKINTNIKSTIEVKNSNMIKENKNGEN